MSLLECVLQDQKTYFSSDGTIFECVYFPNFVVVGEDFISSGELVVQSVRYHFDNISKLVVGRKTFQLLNLGKDEAYWVLEKDHKRSEQISEDHGWPKSSFDPEITNHPHILYYSGQLEIISLQSKLGKVSLSNRPTINTGSSTGIGISNEVIAKIEFGNPKALNEVRCALQNLHGLFELSLGYRQSYHWIELQLVHDSNIAEQDVHKVARLYWSLCNERVRRDSKVALYDSLLSPDRRPEEFIKVTGSWLDSTDDMLDPRERFATSFFDIYSINRIVGAANMFDLLPTSYLPDTKMIDDSVSVSVQECKEILQKLPRDFARDSILSALGRVGKATLRDKIYHRADKINSITGDKFPNLHLPCDQAVKCRNHYVHGSKRGFNYQENFTEFAFITDTLEFVFAISDLIELGWDLNAWLNHSGFSSHALGIYVANYKENLTRLEELVSRE